MTWNWQKPDWPNFTWNNSRLTEAEKQFVLSGGVLIGTAKHLGEDELSQFTIESITGEALTTSEIEGEILDRESVQSSVRRQLGLTSDNRRVGASEQGISEVMVDLYRHFERPLSSDILFAWHEMVTNGRRDLSDIGRYRTGEDPMQVVSGAIGSPRVHFEAPPASRVPFEMAKFIDWFNRSSPVGQNPLPPLTRAGIAHLYFESIHPFEDGNGRIGRSIAEKSLAQSLGQPTIVALATTILARRSSYYEALEAANKNNEITNWLAWFASITLEAQRRTIADVEFLLSKTKLLDSVKGSVNERQLKVLLRILREGPTGFKGGLSAGNYVKITGTSPATATRDLTDLIDKDILHRTGEHKHARYHLNISVRQVPRLTISDAGDVVEA